MVIPYHPVWFGAGLGGLGKAIYGTWSLSICDAFCEMGISDVLDVDSLCVGISWALGGRHFVQRVKAW